jgi:hydroxymethylpyrimidine/phosphomethylpyrimidine kinase
MQQSLRPAKPVALTIAGSDSGGGAGIQADLRTFEACGVHGVTALTAVTAQDTRGVRAIHVVPRAMLRDQLEAVLDDFPVGAAKTGMLASPSIVRDVAAALRRWPRLPLVVDPVLVATTGASLAGEGLADAVRTWLLPRATLLTPNLPEAECLAGLRIRTPAQMLAAARRLREAGAPAVLLKGGHLRGPVRDLLLTAGGERWFEARRARGAHHGTGCTLSAAITAELARGVTLEEAVERGIAFVQRALASAYRPGRGALRVLDHAAAALTRPRR